ncbi:hypothetical protein PsYK624_123090 [Phanerochaete sordida]|uniref:Uncharacterized protein n=1 Tax=Phanerochaete sordida TaxID=48140 RepID=A0A9P3LI24_9APHY|nr:hypothetical protein PsYK624_123090 [Phanerochaete sordida]
MGEPNRALRRWLLYLFITFVGLCCLLALGLGLGLGVNAPKGGINEIFGLPQTTSSSSSASASATGSVQRRAASPKWLDYP